MQRQRGRSRIRGVGPGSGSGGSIINTAARNIASAVRAPGVGAGAISNGTDTTQNTRSEHYNESGVTVTALSLIYCGWHLDLTNETINANDYTVTASIEYPAGTFTQVTWTAATSKSIVAGTNQLSDYVTLTTSIPANAQFWVRTFISVTAGQTWPICNALWGGHDTAESGVGLSDKTMSGTISGNYQGLRPAAIMSQYVVGIRKASVIGLSDSIYFGSGDGNFDIHGNTAWIGRSCTSNTPYITCSVVGTQLQNQVIGGKLAFRLDFITKAGITHIATGWGVNDGLAFATMQTNLQTLWAALKTVSGIKLYQSTIGPKSTTSQGWDTTTAQTPDSNYNGSSANGQLTNNYIRTSPAPLDGFIDNAILLQTSIYSGIWRTGDSNANIHLLTSETLTASGVPTTTSIPSNSTAPALYYDFGNLNWLTGLNAGVRSTGANNAVPPTITCNALTLAPIAGDTFLGLPPGIGTTNDGLHPLNTGNLAAIYSGILFGGVPILVENATPIVQSWNT